MKVSTYENLHKAKEILEEMYAENEDEKISLALFLLDLVKEGGSND